MDEVDWKILRILQESPQISAVELADQVGLSHTPCWRRVKRMEELGVIRERAIILDSRKVDRAISVFAHIRLKQHDEETLDAFERVTSERPEIVDCFSMSGESDYLLRVVVRNVDEYESLLRTTLLHLPGLASINSSFALKCVKNTTRLPI